MAHEIMTDGDKIYVVIDGEEREITPEQAQMLMGQDSEVDFWDKMFPHGRSTAERIQAQPGFGGKASEFAKGVYNMGGDIVSYPGRWVAQTGMHIPMEEMGERPISGQGAAEGANNFIANTLRSPLTALTAGYGLAAPAMGALKTAGVNLAAGAGPAAAEWWANDAPAENIPLQGMTGALMGGVASGAGKLASRGVRFAEDSFRGLSRILAAKAKDGGNAASEKLREFVQPVLNDAWTESGLRRAIDQRVDKMAGASDLASQEISPVATELRNRIRASAGTPAMLRTLPTEREIQAAESMNQMGAHWDPNGPNQSEQLAVGDMIGRAKANAAMNARAGLLKGSLEQINTTLDKIGDAASVLKGHGQSAPITYADFPSLLQRANHAAYHPGTGIAEGNRAEITREAGDLLREELADIRYQNPQLYTETKSELNAARKPFAQAKTMTSAIRHDPTSIQADRTILGTAANLVKAPITIPLMARQLARLGKYGANRAAVYLPPIASDALFVAPRRQDR